MLDYIIIALLVIAILLLAALLIKRNKLDSLAKSVEVERGVSNERHTLAMTTISRGNDKLAEMILTNNEKVLEWQNKQSQALFKHFTEQSESINKTLAENITKLQDSNEQKLEQMRRTVDEKLDETLTKRLDTTFKTVTEQLESLYKSLGEMKGLSAGVSDLQRLLTNVKARGTWAEVQLGEILGQFLTPEQFEHNVSIKKNREQVEYAIRIPSRNESVPYHLLPIDSKFPQEDYLRLQQAAAEADADKVEQCSKALERFIKDEAKKIATLYIDVPTTTDFAIMFLPTEGLYAEVLRMPGLCEDIQNKYRIMICGPTTIAAFLSTIKVGFRTIALDKKASEVLNILSAVKQQYDKYEEILRKAKSKIDEAGQVIEKAQQRSSIINKKLKNIETLPESESEALLGLADGESADEELVEIVGE